MIIDGNWPTAGWTVPTASDSVQGNGIICSGFDVVDGSCRLAPRHRELLDRAVPACMKGVSGNLKDPGVTPNLSTLKAVCKSLLLATCLPRSVVFYSLNRQVYLCIQ